MVKGMRTVVREEEVMEYTVVWHYGRESYAEEAFSTRQEADEYIAGAECPEEYTVEENMVTKYVEEIECMEHDDE
jgi:hypothetical protein